MLFYSETRLRCIKRLNSQRNLSVECRWRKTSLPLRRYYRILFTVPGYRREIFPIPGVITVVTAFPVTVSSSSPHTHSLDTRHFESVTQSSETADFGRGDGEHPATERRQFTVAVHSNKRHRVQGLQPQLVRQSNRLVVRISATTPSVLYCEQWLKWKTAGGGTVDSGFGPCLR